MTSTTTVSNSNDASGGGGGSSSNVLHGRRGFRDSVSDRGRKRARLGAQWMQWTPPTPPPSPRVDCRVGPARLPASHQLRLRRRQRRREVFPDCLLAEGGDWAGRRGGRPAGSRRTTAPSRRRAGGGGKGRVMSQPRATEYPSHLTPGSDGPCAQNCVVKDAGKVGVCRRKLAKKASSLQALLPALAPLGGRRNCGRGSEREVKTPTMLLDDALCL